MLLFGEKPVNFTSVVNVPSISLFDGQVVITGEAIVAIVVSILIVIGLSLFINKTKSGRAMLAVSEDKDAAQLMGININRTISLTFAIGSGLAAIAGALLCSAYPTLQNTTGAMPGIKAFVAAVFGGIGSVPGAVVGAFVIGICENIMKGAGLTTFSDAFTFVLLIVIPNTNAMITMII